MIVIPNKIDLHGLTINRGYNKTFMFVKLCFLHKKRHCKIITGISGKQRKEFESWMKTPKFSKYVDSWKLFDNNGSYILKIRKT